MFKTGLTALAIYAFLTACAFAADDDQLAAKIQDAYKNINSFEANFTQTLTHKESGSVEKREGRLQFQKPLRVRWVTKKPHEETLVINSREIWDYLPDEEVAYRYNPEIAQDSRSIIQVVTGQARLDKDFKVSKKANENGLVKLLLFPGEPTTDLVEAAIWVDPDSGIIERANVTDFYGNTNDIAFKSFKPGVKFPDASFSFKPPKGVEVEDLTKSGIQERNLFK